MPPAPFPPSPRFFPPFYTVVFFLSASPFPAASNSLMASSLEKSRVTEIQVRIDCNGCVQKIKRALQGIKGISDVYIDLPKQKLTIIGSADPDKIIKSIKKARKNAVIISSRSQVQDPPQPPTEPTQSPPETGAPPPQDAGNPPPEPPQPQPPQPDPPKDQQPLQPPTEPPKDQPPANPPTHEPPPPPPPQTTKDEEVAHVVHHQAHHSPDHGYRYGYPTGHSPEPPVYTSGYDPGYYPGPHGCGGDWANPRPGYRAERPEPVHVTHSYNHYRPPPTVTRYEYVQPPSPRFSPYGNNGRVENSFYDGNNGDYYSDNNNNNGYVTSIFSEENPNACTIS